MISFPILFEESKQHTSRIKQKRVRLFSRKNDAVHVIVQPTRQTSATKVVCRPSRQSEEENYTGIDYNNFGKVGGTNEMLTQRIL